MIRTIALIAAALLAGCAHIAQKPVTAAGVGSASYRVADDRGLAHYQLALGKVATGATIEQHVPPAYPTSLLAACPPQIELAARVIVDTRGTVTEVRMDPPPGKAPFADAVRQAVRSWRYAPLTVTRWAADAQGDSHPVDTAAQPFSLDYVFTFRCEHGRPSVSSGPQSAAR